MTNHFPDKISKHAFIIFLLASFFFFYDFIGQVYPGVILHDLMHDFSANATRLGVMAGCFYYAYALMQIPAAMLIDRFGARLVLTVVITLCAISFLWFSLSDSLFAAAIARLLTGATAGFAFVGTLYLIIRWFPPKYFAMFAGMTTAMGSLGAVVVNKPLALIAHHFGWRHGLMGIAIFGLVLAVLFCFVIRDKSPQFVVDTHHIKGNLKKRLTMVFGNGQTWFIGFCSFTTWAPILAFAALWGVPFLKISCHLNTIEAAEVISFAWIGVTIGSPLLGWLSEWIGRRCLLVSFCSLIGMLVISVLIFVSDIPFVLLCGLLFLLGVVSSVPAVLFALVKDNHSPLTGGIANGFNNMACVMAGMVFQPLIGRFLDLHWQGNMVGGVHIYSIHSYREAFFILPVGFFVSFIVSAFFIKETYCRHVYESENE